MAAGSPIEWTEATWNPVTGCTKISHGCKHCYAERMSRKLQRIGVGKYADGFSVAVHEYVLEDPIRWRQPRLVFVNLMSDLFHKSVPTAFYRGGFRGHERASRHTFQVLTKRPGRVVRLDRRLRWSPNIWIGTSIESEQWLGRIDALKETGAATKFLSLEPLLGPLPDLPLDSIDWVIAGGESEPGARSMEAAWHPRQLREERGPVLLQTVGRRVQETDWLDARRQDLEPDTDDNKGTVTDSTRTVMGRGLGTDIAPGCRTG